MKGFYRSNFSNMEFLVYATEIKTDLIEVEGEQKLLWGILFELNCFETTIDFRQQHKLLALKE